VYQINSAPVRLVSATWPFVRSHGRLVLNAVRPRAAIRQV